jgi:hypothetical protein
MKNETNLIQVVENGQVLSQKLPDHVKKYLLILTKRFEGKFTNLVDTNANIQVFEK